LGHPRRRSLQFYHSQTTRGPEYNFAFSSKSNKEKEELQPSEHSHIQSSLVFSPEMISNNLEAGAHYDGMNSAESEMLSENNESSFYQKQDSSDRGGTEPKRKLKKLRSIKLSRLPSQRSSTRRSKFRNDHLPVTLSEASPNYMKATNSSDARKESLQASFL
jgi:hypothetical protein